MTPLAFRATYSDWKLVKTRGVVQIVMEVPIADYRAALEVLGGMPDPARENWFAVAPLKMSQTGKEIEATAHDVLPATPRRLDKPAGAKRDWRDMKPSAQAAIRCGEAIFWAYLNEEHGYRVTDKEEAAEAVREKCFVNSRKMLDDPTHHSNRVIWHQLDSGYIAWKALEHA